ncbi:MAG TPA: hypothetical protein VHU92_16835 [Streptosporangiaceae bacterium]|jgi:hypothetical protein|nr:hypothetical protein [Streptosporangiaceae bacterium]
MSVIVSVDSSAGLTSTRNAIRLGALALPRTLGADRARENAGQADAGSSRYDADKSLR